MWDGRESVLASNIKRNGAGESSKGCSRVQPGDEGDHTLRDNTLKEPEIDVKEERTRISFMHPPMFNKRGKWCWGFWFETAVVRGGRQECF